MKERRIHALIGPNGAGKTTTLSMINGTETPTEGKILLFGQDITGLPAHEVAPKGMGRTYQNIKLFGSLSVLDNLMVGAMQKYNKGGVVHFLFHVKESNRMEREMKEKALYIAEELGIYKMKDELARNLPYGLQKVLELGRALMGSPKLILLDEPAAGLNPSERAHFIWVPGIKTSIRKEQENRDAGRTEYLNLLWECLRTTQCIISCRERRDCLNHWCKRRG